jgi:Flp pilus assembly pilin Flp
MLRYLSKALKEDKGAAAVEFALIAPFLIMMLVGIMDFGRFINQRMELENLARAAAEYVVKGGDESLVTQDVILMSGKITEEDLPGVQQEGDSVCECDNGEEVTCGTTCSGSDTTYQRRYYNFSLTRSFTPMFPYPGIPDTITLTGNARLQIQ